MNFLLCCSDGWADRPDVVAGIQDAAVGGISMKLMSDDIPSFDSYFRSLVPENNTRNPWFREFWQWKFQCFLTSLPMDEQDRRQNRSCKGDERISEVNQDAKLGFVIKAIYALAHALHNMHQDICGGVPGVCDDMVPIEGQLLLEYLMNVSFSYNKESVFFDNSGDPPPRYYIMTYQRVELPDGEFKYGYKQTGTWRSGNLTMNHPYLKYPSHGFGHVVTSVCSDECRKGFVKKVHGNVACCWVCTPCRENEILLDSETCYPCSRGWWPNQNLTACQMIPVEHTTWWNTDAMVALITACVGIFVTLWVSVVFIRHNNTPVVKASTRELSYILLLGVIMAFSSNFVLVAKPTLVTCYFTRILPGMSFSLMYGALVTKTNRIARILEGTKKIITKKPRFMSASAQVIITCILIGVECAIITIMLVIEPADSKLDYPEMRRVKLICNTTTIGIIVPLGFDLILIILCTLYAVKTRNLPENFNEAKFIGFSMYTTCVIWLGFTAIYFGSERKVITMSVSVSLSAIVALVLLFFPKVYIIIWAPEKNTRSAFTTSKDVRCHIGSISCASGESMDLVRERKHLDIHGLPIKHQRSFLDRLKYGGITGQKLRKQQSIPIPKVTRDAAKCLRRDNSFHVTISSGSDSKPPTFSWANMMTNAGWSEEDQLSTIISKDGTNESKNKKVTFEKKDCSCQTDEELLQSILNMPYLRRRRGKKIERTEATVDDSFVYCMPAFKNTCQRRSSVSSSESGYRDDSRKHKTGAQVVSSAETEKTFLFPRYTDSPISTSDDIENEEEFEYYEGISDLLRTHGAPAQTGAPLNHVHHNHTHIVAKNVSCNKIRTATLTSSSTVVSDSPSLQLVVQDRGTDGTSTMIFREPLQYRTDPNASDHGTTNSVNPCKVGMEVLANSTDATLRSHSPSTGSSSTTALTKQGHRRPSAFSQTSFCSTKENSVQSFKSIKGTDDMTERYVKAIDDEESSMLEFQTFLRERGVQLDMSYIESSDV